MQKVYNVDRWSRLEEGKALQLPGTTPRRIRIDVNAPQEVRLWYTGEDGELYFLGLAKGRDTIEFTSVGLCQVHAEGGDCFIYTSDGDNIAQVVEAPVIFTKIMERRPRNLELERIAYEMRANNQRMLDQQAEQLELLMERRFAAREAQLAAASAAAGAGSEPESAADGGRPSEAAAGSGGGGGSPS